MLKKDQKDLKKDLIFQKEQSLNWRKSKKKLSREVHKLEKIADELQIAQKEIKTFQKEMKTITEERDLAQTSSASQQFLLSEERQKNKGLVAENKKLEQTVAQLQYSTDYLQGQLIDNAPMSLLCDTDRKKY